jgi:hypothetical protein
MADDRDNGSGESAEKFPDQDRVPLGEGLAATGDTGQPDDENGDNNNALDWARFVGLISVLLAIGAILPIAQEYIKHTTAALILSVLLVAAAAYLIATAPAHMSRLRKARDRTISLRAPALVAVLGLAAVTGAGAGFGVTVMAGPHGRSAPTGNNRLVIVQLAGSSGFFSDPAVQKELRHEKFVVQQPTPAGSLDVCHIPLLVQDYDMTNSGSQEAAACVYQILAKASRAQDPSYPFASPMVIITYTPIVRLLEQIHVVKEDHGIAVFNVLKYLNVVRRGEQWYRIPRNKAYPNHSRILLATTNPQDSNSGGMFAAIAYAALNNDSPVAAPMKPAYVKVIRQCFREQPDMATHTDFLLNDFLANGMSEYPMAMIYENDYIYTQLDGRTLLSGRPGPNHQITVMYPNPDVVPVNTLISWTRNGIILTNLLKTPTMERFEEEHGYRTSSDSNSFVKYMAGNGITVPSLHNPPMQIVGPPQEPNLQALINAVVPPKPSD